MTRERRQEIIRNLTQGAEAARLYNRRHARIIPEPDVLEQQWRYLIVRYNNKPGYLPTGFVVGGERRTALIGILTHVHTFAVVPDEDGLELQISFVVEEERGGGDKKDDKIS